MKNKQYVYCGATEELKEMTFVVQEEKEGVVTEYVRKYDIKENLYFRDIDDTNCHPLIWHLDDAILEGLDKVTLVEAIPDNDNPNYIWCGVQDKVGERSECRKSFCFNYESKSGRGVCKHRGNLYTYGEEVEFKIE